MHRTWGRTILSSGVSAIQKTVPVELVENILRITSRVTMDEQAAVVAICERK
jgi:hypothetical protein